MDTEVKAWLEKDYSPSMGQSTDSTVSAVPEDEEINDSEEPAPSNLLTIQQSQFYRKKISVFAFRAGKEVTVEKAWGLSTAQPNDWVIINQGTDVYCCPEDVFTSSYERTPDELHRYRKTDYVSAVQLKEAVELQTAAGNRGDYLVQSAIGEQWIVPQHIFETTYELIASSEEKDSLISPSQPTAFLNSCQLQPLLKNINDWHFDVFQLDASTGGHSLFVLAKHFLTHFDLLNQFDIDDLTLDQFLLAVEANSTQLFHCAARAAAVLHSVVCLIRFTPLRDIVDSNLVLSAIFAAILCCYQHTGFSNSFLIRTRHPLSILYNDQSIGENHTAASAFKLIEQLNLFQRVPSALLQNLRKQIVDLLFAFDSHQHFEVLNAFKALPAESPDALICLKFAMKCASCSFSTQKWELQKQWSDLLLKEMFNQGDMEKSLSIPLSPYMNRHSSSPAAFQLAWFGWVVKPLFASLQAKLPFDRREQWEKHFIDNYKKWEKSSQQ